MDYEMEMTEEKQHGVSRAMMFFLVLLVPLAVVLLSSSIILHIPQTYEFYFNDSQSIDRIEYSVTVSELGDAITKYLSSMGGKPFQIYEINGVYEDPVFSGADQDVMERARSFLLGETILALVFLLLSLLIFWNSLRKGMAELLRIVSWITIVTCAAAVVIHQLLLNSPDFQSFLYQKIIGIDLPKTSNLFLLLGDGGLYGTYAVFQAMLAAVLTAAFAYFSLRATKPNRLFY